MAGRRIVVVVNPTSGRGRVGRNASALLAALASRGDDVVAVTGPGAQQAGAMLAEEVARGADAVVAAGGDGTVHMALQAAVPARLPLGVVPMGTGNDAASALGVPPAPADAVRCILAGRVRSFDTGVVHTADGVRRHFLCVLSSGFDSAVNERANRLRRPSGDLRYVVAMVAELRTFRPIAYEVEVDGVPRREDAMLVSVGNGPSYGGGMRVCPGADLHDGLLTLVWVHPLSRAGLLRVFPSVYSGAHVNHWAVTQESARSVRLRAAGQVAYADGERIGLLPVSVTAVPDAVRVLVPG